MEAQQSFKDFVKDNESDRPPWERSDAALELAWRRATRRDPFVTGYAAAKDVHLSSEAVSCENFERALKAMWRVTGDMRFVAAACAMSDHNLTYGFVKARLLSLAAGMRAERAAVPFIDAWVKRQVGRKKISPTLAAKLVAVELGIPGISFAEVVRDISREYTAWEKSTKVSSE